MIRQGLSQQVPAISEFESDANVPRRRVWLLFSPHVTLFEIKRRVAVAIRWPWRHVHARIAWYQLDHNALHCRKARIGNEVLQDRLRSEDFLRTRCSNLASPAFQHLLQCH
jgi:hypothetical protein